MWLLDWIIQTSLTATLLALIGFAAALWYLKPKYPHGPSWFTSLRVGLIDFEDILDYHEIWKRQFGLVYALFNGRNPRVFMTNYDVIQDAFVRQADSCSSRPQGSGSLHPALIDKGIIASPHWKEQRKFVLAVLRELGMGKIDMEYKIMEEVGPLLSELERHQGRSLDVDGYMHRAISNVICNLVLGSRFDCNSPVFASLLKNFANQTRLKRKMELIHSTPLRYLPGDIFGYHRYVENECANMEYFRNAIHHHKETLDPDNPRDFIDAYLIQMKEAEQHKEQSSFDEMNCVASIVELFIAGTDTTANTLMWAWLFMILHPEIQQRVQQEIDICFGLQPPSLKDKVRMPYTEAVLTEVMRLANTAAATLPHKVETDMTIAGHVIPKNAVLHACLSNVHLDDKNYPSPRQFNPQRFLTAEGDFQKPKKFIPFGIGRRACPGESLARAELFLFFTSVLQRFSVSSPIGCSVKAEGKVGLIHHPLAYLAVFKQRCSG